MFIVELPSLCTCMSWCRAVQRYSKFLEMNWVRGLIYTGLAACGWALYSHDRGQQSVAGVILWITVPLAGLLYFLSIYFYGDEPSAGAGASTAGATSPYAALPGDASKPLRGGKPSSSSSSASTKDVEKRWMEEVAKDGGSAW